MDRTRLLRLSNQIIEFGTDRYRSDATETQLRSLADEMLALKGRMQSLASLGQGEQQAKALAAMQIEIERQARQLQGFAGELRYHHQRSTAMLDDLRDQVFGLMLRPLSSVFAAFPRTVRDVAARAGKKVQLTLAGDKIEMDQLTAEALMEPLVHLINNAIAHGIESSEARLERGKREEGKVVIAASMQGHMVCIDVMDDGAGLDLDAIARKAIAIGLISAQEADEMSENEMLELIFQPGFSTRSTVTDLAGRGMGMTIAQDVIRELTGTIHIRTEKGRGTRFRLTVPAAVGLQQVMIFTVAGQQFGMLEDLVEQVLPLQEQVIKQGHGPYARGYIDYEGQRVPLIDMAQMVAGVQARDHSASSVLIVSHMDGYLAVVVDQLLESQKVMLREVDPYLRHYRPAGLMGCAIIADGSVLLMLEPNGLKMMWRTAPDIDLEKVRDAIPQPIQRHVLLVDDSSLALQIERAMFETIGCRVDTAIGAADMLEKVRLRDYDLLVTDIDMPDMDGITLISRLRSQEALKDTPILIIATRESEHDQQLALAAGASAFLAKRNLKGGENMLSEILSEIFD
ncbi:hybrid sensor histidine kinase/response regulator [Mariprofundus erugo]|uniref:hybrid sensor histidine kinase/response regulator n=1 Tax=Mariprofundus erugo TaxID=2528639 RepID=UPI001EE875DB|nr:response regulator [Mariprofundus erugo]